MPPILVVQKAHHAQLDRFLMQIAVGYPHHAAEVAVLVGGYAATVVENLPAVTTASEVGCLAAAHRAVHRITTA